MSATNRSITFCNAWHLSTIVAGALSPPAAAKRHFTIGDHGCATLWVVARMSHSYIQNLICCTHSPIMASGWRQRCRRPCIRVRTEAWWVRHGFVPDHTWAEMLRISPTWSIGEGGLFGCWFEVSIGSGVGVNVGRSLRAIHRTHLAAALGFNVTALFDRPIRGREHLWEAWRRGQAAAMRGSPSPSNRTSAMTNASSSSTTTTSMWPPPMCGGLSLSLRRGEVDGL